MDFFLPLFNSVILAVLTLFLAVYYLSSRPRTAKPRVAKTSAAPEPDGAWPIIGHLHLLGGPYWRELRKITSIELLSSHRLELLKHVRASETEISIKELYKVWSEKKNYSGRVLVEMKQWFGDLTLNVILRMIAGKRYFGATVAGDEAEAQRCQKVMRAFFHYLGLFLVSDMIPFLGWLDLGGHEKGMKETANEIDYIIGEWLKEHREMRNSAKDDGVQKDFIDVLLSAVGGEVSGFDADTIIKSTCSLPHITLGAMADKYGPIFTIRLGVQRALVVSNWEIAKELHTSCDVVISSRPKFRAAKHLAYNYAMFGFSPYGPYWRELRKITSIELLSSHRLELLKHVRVSETEICIKELYQVWSEKKNYSGLVLVELKQWFGDLTLNVILRMIAGKRYFGASAAGDEAEARRFQKAMRAFFRYLGLFLVSDMIPFLGWLDLGGHEKGMKETAKEIDSIVGEWLKEHREMRSSAEDDGVQKDFVDVLLSAVEGAVNLSGFDADTIIKSTCLNIIAGGGDTTTVMLIWALSLLLNNRHALKRTQDELDEHVGKDRQVNESDINNLVYLQAVVKETLRLYPAAPLSAPREFAEDCTVGDFHVRKGTRLIMNLGKLQRDPKVWSNPAEFRPERFLTTHKDVDVKGQHFELIPFGAGRRSCPGTNFGVQMLHLVLATLLHSFELSSPVDAPVDMTESAGLTNLKATPLEVLLAPRLSPNLSIGLYSAIHRCLSDGEID
ncbi:hypothetical protein RJ640_020344 [Escallonia rubra]|uniref:Cytochrome P450 n=1 Tax=Escallonia rubra TaxID=112253 RepID=A0AA88QXV4_9ASTE|nr:hypothetical protein RJ640_020344 [Escallonia rubra]